MGVIGNKVVLCDICKNCVSSLVSHDFALDALVICGPCAARVPDKLMDEFLTCISWPLEKAFDSSKENKNNDW